MRTCGPSANGGAVLLADRRLTMDTRSYDRLIVYLTIAVCVATFWAGVMAAGVITRGWAAWTIPTGFVIGWCGAMLAIGICCGGAIQRE